MAQFPVYNSSGNINITRLPERQGMAAEAFKGVEEVNKTLTDITQKLSDAHDVMQETKLKTYYETSYAQQELAAQQDPNPDNVEMHIKAIQDIQKNAPKIDNQQVAAQATAEMNQSGFLTGIKIQDMFTKKKMIQNGANYMTLADQYAKNVANAITPAQAQQDTDNFMQLGRDQQATKLLSESDAKAGVKEFQEVIVKTRISNLNSINEEDYKNVADGVPLDLRQSADKDKMIAAHIKQVKEQDVVNKYNNTVNVLKTIGTNPGDWKTTDQIKALSKGDSKLQNALQLVMDARAAGGEYQPKQPDEDATSEAIIKTVKGLNVDELQKYLVDAVGEKGMTEDRLAILINAVEDKRQMLPPKGIKDPNPALAAVEGGFNAIERWNRAHGNNDPQVLSDYLSAVHQGKSPVEAYQLAVETRQKKTNPVRSQYQIGQTVFNKKTGTSGEIVGFDDNGAPLVRVKHGKPKPEQQPKQSAEQSK